MTLRDSSMVSHLLRHHFLSFVRRCFDHLNPNATYLPNWHIEAIAYHLELVRLGKIRRLIINVPPRSLKSLMASIAFPAFVLGRDPSRQVITTSYAADLAVKFANDSRAIMSSSWYKRTFLATRLSSTKNTESEVVTTRFGSRLAASVGGPLTGRGADIIVVDDPLKPQDALSKIKRDATNEWFRNTLLSRLNDKENGSIVVIMQRLHMDDLVGHLLQNSSASGWVILSLPTIAEEEEHIQIDEKTYHVRKVGDVLHAARESPARLESIRAESGHDIFSAQYQQSPVSPEGNLVKKAWIRRYNTIPDRTSSVHVLQSWDTATKTADHNDWSVCTTWYICDGKYHLVDVFRRRLNYPELRNEAIALAKRFKPTTILIEDSGVGIALHQELQAQNLPAIAVPVEHNKLVRMSIQSGKFERGLIYLPDSAHWLVDLETELFAFPHAIHDDQVDSISQALGHEIRKLGWDSKSLEGLSNFVDALSSDFAFGRFVGRPY